jgi:hypothetical protein
MFALCHFDNRPMRAWCTRSGFRYIEDTDLWRHVLPDAKLWKLGLKAADLHYDVSSEAGEPWGHCMPVATNAAGCGEAQVTASSQFAVFTTLLHLDRAELVAMGQVEQATLVTQVAGDIARSFCVRIPAEDDGGVDNMLQRTCASAPASAPAFASASTSASTTSPTSISATAGADEQHPSTSKVMSQPQLWCLATASCFPTNRSTLGNELAQASSDKGLAAAGIVVLSADCRGPEQMLKLSFRSLQGPGSVDVSAVAKRFGGGGHRNAASAVVTATAFEAWKVGQ